MFSYRIYLFLFNTLTFWYNYIYYKYNKTILYNKYIFISLLYIDYMYKIYNKYILLCVSNLYIIIIDNYIS